MGALEGCLKKMNREGSERANERTRRKPFTKTKSLAGINGRYFRKGSVCVALYFVLQNLCGSLFKEMEMLRYNRYSLNRHCAYTYP